MKRLLAILLAICMLAAITSCGTTTPAGSAVPEQSTSTESSAVTEPEESVVIPDSVTDGFKFTRDNFPVMDGSTSMVPLGAGIASVLLGETREQAEDLIAFNKTTQSFRNLRQGLCDIVIAAEPKAEVFEEMEADHFEYEIEEIAKEALVFVVNEDNPVNSLTSQQIVDIYAGKITNWSEVGGENAPIEAFQRNAGAGSQVMMEKLVMCGTSMAEAPITYMPSSMGELIESVKSYDNSANAIGYTVYYYATDMEMARGLKILSVDGVMPRPESIRSGDYPYVNGYYSCIPADTPSDAPARILYQWLVSKAGQKLLDMEGYVSISSDDALPGDDVAADYSNYVPYGAPEATYTIRADGVKENLASGADYGMLLPYQGTILYSNSADVFWSPGAMYGFCNTKGELLTEANYSSIYLRAGDKPENSIWIFSETADSEDGEFDQPTLNGFARLDGNFVSEMRYNTIIPCGDKVLAKYWTDDGERFDLYDANGKIIMTQDDKKLNGYPVLLDGYKDGHYVAYIENGTSEYYHADYFYLNESFEVESGPWNYITFLESGLLMVRDEGDMTLILGKDYKPVSYDGQDTFQYAWTDTEDVIAMTKMDDTEMVCNVDGTVIAAGFYNHFTTEEYVITVDENTAVFYDHHGNKLFEKECNFGWCWVTDGIFFESIGDKGLILRDLIHDKEVTFENAWYAYSMTSSGDYILVYQEEPDMESECYAILDKELNVVAENCGDFQEIWDSMTDESYVEQPNSYGFSGETTIYSADLSEEIFRAKGSVVICGGYFLVSTDLAYSIYNSDSELIFCYPFLGSPSGD